MKTKRSLYLRLERVVLYTSYISSTDRSSTYISLIDRSSTDRPSTYISLLDRSSTDRSSTDRSSDPNLPVWYDVQDLENLPNYRYIIYRYIM